MHTLNIVNRTERSTYKGTHFFQQETPNLNVQNIKPQNSFLVIYFLHIVEASYHFEQKYLFFKGFDIFYLKIQNYLLTNFLAVLGNLRQFDFFIFDQIMLSPYTFRWCTTSILMLTIRVLGQFQTSPGRGGWTKSEIKGISVQH